MDDRTDRDVQATDRQVAQTVAVVLLAYDRLVRNNGTSQDRARFVRFAALRLATVLRLVSLSVDALILAMLTRSRRRYVAVIPSTPADPVRRLERALTTILDDELPPEPPEPLEVVSEDEPLPADETEALDDAEEEADESSDQETPEVEDADTSADEDESDGTTTTDEGDAESAEAFERAVDELGARFDAEADRIAEQEEADQADDDQEDDEPDSDEDRAIMEEYRRTVERAAERQRSRIERLIQTEIKTRSREAFAEALGKRKLSAVWIARPNACPICTKLDGTIIGPGEEVPTSHPGCSCRIRPTLVINDPYISTGSAA